MIADGVLENPRPELVTDPVIAASRVVENLQTIVSRELKPGTPAVVSVTSFIAGNGSLNIIPDKAEINVGFRALDKETRAYLRKRIVEILETTAEVNGARGYAEELAGCAPAVNDPDCAEYFICKQK